MTFAQGRSRLTTRFAERIPVGKRRMTVLYICRAIDNIQMVIYYNLLHCCISICKLLLHVSAGTRSHHHEVNTRAMFS